MTSNVQAAINTASVLHDIESGQMLAGGDHDSKKDDDGKSWFHQFGLVTSIMLGVGIASVTLNILSMIFYNQSGSVIVMGLIAIVLAPTVMKRQIDMENKDAMRTLQNKLRQNVNTLSIENTKLSKEITKFSEQVQSLKGCELELENIAKENEQDVDNLVSLVKENGRITAALMEAAVSQAIQQVIDIFLDSDRDESASLSEKEIRILIDVRLAQLDNVSVKKEILKEKLNQDFSLAGIMAILHASLKKDTPPENRVFDFKYNN